MELSPEAQAVRGRSCLERGAPGIHAAPERAARCAEVRAAVRSGLRPLARQGSHRPHQLSGVFFAATILPTKEEMGRLMGPKPIGRRRALGLGAATLMTTLCSGR